MPPDSSHQPALREFLADRARHASDTRLALDVAGGVVAAVAMLAWRPAQWVLVLAIALCFAGFGGWGIADRELTGARTASHAMRTRALVALRALGATLGVAAALLVLFRVFALALGTWIS